MVMIVSPFAFGGQRYYKGTASSKVIEKDGKVYAELSSEQAGERIRDRHFITIGKQKPTYHQQTDR
jgi:hypothetical protein